MNIEEDVRCLMDDEECSVVLHKMANEATRRMKLAMRLGMNHDYWYQASNVLRSSAMLMEKVEEKENEDTSHEKKKEKITRSHEKEDISR